MKKYLFTLFIFCSLFSYAQNEANIWCFGDGGGLDFNSGSPVPFLGVAMNQFEGCTSIADNTGSLLFYSDGITVWNKNHLIMPNGTGLLGNYSSTQSGVIVKQPGTASTYYLFTPDAFGGPNGLNYSVIDMTMQGGLGDVTVKNVQILPLCDERITAVYHSNGNDIWIVSTSNQGNSIYSFLLSSTGLNLVPVTSTNAVTHSTPADEVGYLKASPQGNHLGMALYGTGSFEILDFDNATGIASNGFDMFSLNYAFAYGIEFSPDGTKFYGCEEILSTIYQFNLLAGSAAAIAASATIVGVNTPPHSGALQLGPDGKVYTAKVLSNYLGVINDPNQLGAACNFVDTGVFLLSPSLCEGGLPNFFVSVFNATPPTALFTAPNHICPGTCTDFINNSINASSFSWTFAGANPSTSTDANPANICYNTPGTYSVSLIATNAIGSDTLTLNNFVTVYPYPPPQGIAQSGDSLIANQGAVSYQWYHDGVLIPGATNYFYVQSEGGDFNVVCTDANGCEVEAGIFDVPMGIQSAVINHQSLGVFPNPVNEKLEIRNLKTISAIDISIYNMLGEKIYSAINCKQSTVDCRLLSKGMYWLEVNSAEGIFRTKFRKE